MNTAVFSLRRLPDHVRLQVIKSFDQIELIAYSLISRKSKALVQSFNLEVDNFVISNEGNLLQYSLTFKGCDESNDFQIYYVSKALVKLVSLNAITNIIRVGGQSGPQRLFWRTPDLSFVGWFEHFESLFKFSKTEFFVRCNQEIYNTEEIRNLLSEWTSVKVITTCSHYHQKTCDLFSPCVKNLKSYINKIYPTFPQKNGIQNFDNFESSYPLKLDDLLSLNAINICIHDLSISNINRFVKAWIKGSNSRMQSICIFLEEDMDETKLLKGIPHQFAPVRVKRTRDGRIVTGHVDIRNNKGIMATIDMYAYLFGMKITVWN